MGRNGDTRGKLKEGGVRRLPPFLPSGWRGLCDYFWITTKCKTADTRPTQLYVPFLDIFSLLHSLSLFLSCHFFTACETTKPSFHLEKKPWARENTLQTPSLVTYKEESFPTLSSISQELFLYTSPQPLSLCLSIFLMLIIAELVFPRAISILSFILSLVIESADGKYK